MADEFFHKNPRDATKERFMRLEEKFVEISHNIVVLMVTLVNNFEPFEDFGGSNSKVGLDEKLR
jgi:hypothetical protein